MNSITKNAYAKINLTLDVLEKLPSSYHRLEMIMQQISMHDVVTVSKTDSNDVFLDCNKNVCEMKDNIAYKGAILMKNTYDIKDGIYINIEKNIFTAGGLAGGSSDCATTMLCINELFELNRPLLELIELSTTLGSDIAFCMMGGTSLATGTGTTLERISSHRKTYIVVANPSIEVSTKEVFEKFQFSNQKQSDYDIILKALDENDVQTVSSNFNNMLETVTINLYPVIGHIKEKMIETGAMGALMSGSGATVFGYYKSESDATRSKNEILKTFSNVKAEVCYTLN